MTVGNADFRQLNGMMQYGAVNLLQVEHSRSTKPYQYRLQMMHLLLDSIQR